MEARQIEPISRFRGLVHYVRDKNVLASRGSRVFQSHDAGHTWELLCEVPCENTWRLKSSTDLSRRLFRAGLGHVIPVSRGRYLVFGFRKILVYDSNSGRFLKRGTELAGSRPLSLCQVRMDEVYYGEYCRNPDRQPVSVWATDDGGEHWHEAIRFQRVRHVHGVFHDPYSGHLWVTTGDDDEESAIWLTTDRFRSLDKVLSGSQQARAVDLVFTRSHVYFGSDTPREKNWLYRWCRRTAEVERVQRVESSVFFGARVDDWILFTTACEPSRVNPSRSVELWGSTDGEAWTRLLTLKKDFWPCKYMQHGQIRFPLGSPGGNRFWLSPIAVQGHGHALVCSLPYLPGRHRDIPAKAA